MSAVIIPASAAAQVAAASSTAPQLVLQPGTVIDARVLAVRENLARILIAGLSLEVLTEVALEPGANLKLAVSQMSDRGVRLQVVPQTAVAVAQGQGSANAVAISARPTTGATGPEQLARGALASLVLATPEELAIGQAVQAAAPRQASLSTLFANLPVIVAATGVPRDVQNAAAQLLAARSTLDATLTAATLREAFKTSGLFLEATLARGAAPSGQPDLKAALVVFRQVLANWLGQGAAAPSSAAAQTLRQAAAPPLALALAGDPASAERVARAETAARTADLSATLQARLSASAPGQPAAGDLADEILRTATQALLRDAVPSQGRAALDQHQPAGPSLNQPPAPRQAEAAPPFRGALPSAQPVATPSLAADTAPAHMGHQLLEQTDAALARQTLLQAASLPDRQEPADSQPRWSFEIPFATPQGTAIAQFEISRDGRDNEAEATAPSRVWRARFTLDVEPAGPVHAQVALVGEKTAVRMWAERPETAAKLRADAEQLGEALREAELVPGDILVGDGVPPQPKTSAGRFMDRAT